jgi:hypothetical protein
MRITALSIAAATIMLTACGELGDRTYRVDRTEANFAKICLEGTAYWFRSVLDRSYLAPVMTMAADGTPRLEACTLESVAADNLKFQRKVDK